MSSEVEDPMARMEEMREEVSQIMKHLAKMKEIIRQQDIAISNIRDKLLEVAHSIFWLNSSTSSAHLGVR